MTATTEQPDPLLTLAELAAYLRVTPRTAYKLVSTGEVPARKIGGVWRIPRGALEERTGETRPSA